MPKHAFGTIHPHPTRPVDAADTRAVQDAVRFAESNHQRVHAVGSAWSSTDVFVSDEVLIETQRMAALHAVVGDGVDPSSLGGHAWLQQGLLPLRQRSHFAFVDAGITIHALYQALDATAPRLTLRVMGGSTGQTIAGVAGTGTHGGDLSNPPIADTVRAVRLVAPGARRYWVEPEGDDALTRPGWVHRFRSQVEVDEAIHDSELFYAAITSVGCLGVITALVLEVERQFGLTESVTRTTWEEVRQELVANPVPDLAMLQRLGVRVERDEPGDGAPAQQGDRRRPGELVDLEIMINPYPETPYVSSTLEQSSSSDPFGEVRVPRPGRVGRPVDLITRLSAGTWPLDMPPRPGAPERPPRPEPDLLLLLQTVFVAAFGPIGSVGPLVSNLMHATRFDTEQPYRASYLRDTYRGGADLPGVTSEICITTADQRHVHLLDDLLAAFDRYVRETGNWFSGFFSVRFQRPSRALVSMQHDASDSPHSVCHVEAQALINVGEAVLDALANVLHHGSVPRPHSGDMQGMSDEFMRRFEAVGHAHGARFHWGQLNLLNRDRVERAYSDTLFRFRRSRTRLAQRGNGRTFSNDHSERTGLESYGEVVAMCASGSERYDLFGYRENGDLVHASWNGRHWQEPRRIDNPFGTSSQRFTGPMACTATADGQAELFGMGMGTTMLHYVRGAHGGTPGTLAGYAEADLHFNGPISACHLLLDGADTPQVILIGQGPAGQILSAQQIEGRWTVSVLLESVFDQRCHGRVIACADSRHRLDVFARSRDGAILHAMRTGTDWRFDRIDVSLSGDRLATPLACCSRGEGRLDLFSVSELGALVRISTDGGQWQATSHSPPRELGALPYRAPLAQTQATIETAPHYKPVEINRRNTFFGELAVACLPEQDRIDVIGLGRGRTAGTRRSWYHASFSGHRLASWTRHPAHFWDE